MRQMELLFSFKGQFETMLITDVADVWQYWELLTSTSSSEKENSRGWNVLKDGGPSISRSGAKKQ